MTPYVTIITQNLNLSIRPKGKRSQHEKELCTPELFTWPQKTTASSADVERKATVAGMKYLQSVMSEDCWRVGIVNTEQNRTELNTSTP